MPQLTQVANAFASTRGSEVLAMMPTPTPTTPALCRRVSGALDTTESIRQQFTATNAPNPCPRVPRAVGPEAAETRRVPAIDVKDKTVAEFERQWYLQSRPSRRQPKRNRVLTEQRKARALELLADGKTYRETAKELGYANPSSVHRLVGRALAKNVADNIDALRAVEYDRLNALQAALWPKAMAGDVRAANAVLCIVRLRIRLILGTPRSSCSGERGAPKGHNAADTSDSSPFLVSFEELLSDAEGQPQNLRRGGIKVSEVSRHAAD